MTFKTTLAASVLLLCSCFQRAVTYAPDPDVQTTTRSTSGTDAPPANQTAPNTRGPSGKEKPSASDVSQPGVH